MCVYMCICVYMCVCIVYTVCEGTYKGYIEVCLLYILYEYVVRIHCMASTDASHDFHIYTHIHTCTHATTTTTPPSHHTQNTPPTNTHPHTPQTGACWLRKNPASHTPSPPRQTTPTNHLFYHHPPSHQASNSSPHVCNPTSCWLQGRACAHWCAACAAWGGALDHRGCSVQGLQQQHV